MRELLTVVAGVGTPVFPQQLDFGSPRLGYSWTIENINIEMVGTNMVTAPGPTATFKLYIAGVEAFSQREQLVTPTGTGTYTAGPFSLSLPQGFNVSQGQQVRLEVNLDNNTINLTPDRTTATMQIDRRHGRGDD